MFLCSEGAFFATSQKCVLVCLGGFWQERNMMQGFGLWFTQKTIKKRCSYESPRKHTSIHFCDVAKKASSEHRFIWNTYTSGSGKACEKSAKKVVPTSLDLSLLYTSTFCKKCKILTHGNSKRFWRGQMVNVRHSDLSVVYETRFFSKKTKILQKNVKNLRVGKKRMRGPKKDRPIECSGG